MTRVNTSEPMLEPSSQATCKSMQVLQAGA